MADGKPDEERPSPLRCAGGLGAGLSAGVVSRQLAESPREDARPCSVSGTQREQQIQSELELHHETGHSQQNEQRAD